MKCNRFLNVLIILGIFVCNCTSCENSMENSVKVKSIKGSKIGETIEPLERHSLFTDTKPIDKNDETNSIFVEKIEECEFQFTIFLDNPEAYGIDSLRIKCEDKRAEIMIDGEYKPVSKESDGSRVINWSSEDPYEKTFYVKLGYNPQYEFNILEVVDIRLSGHELFLSKETNSLDFGNNSLLICVIDYDVLTKNVVSMDNNLIRINYKIKDKYKDKISNICINGEAANENGYWEFQEDTTYTVTFDFNLNDSNLVVKRTFTDIVKKLDVYSWAYYDWFTNGNFNSSDYLIIPTLVYGITPAYAFNFNISDGCYNECMVVTYKGVKLELVHEFWSKWGSIVFYPPVNDDFNFTLNNNRDLYNDIALKCREFRFYLGTSIYILEFENVYINRKYYDFPVGLKEVTE